MKRVLETKEVAGQSPNYLLAKAQDLVDWAVNSSRANSLWPMPFGTACCAIEFMATAASRYDFARFGMERQAFSPRQADVLICAGRLPFKLAPVIRRIYDQMPQPKWVISMGACASTGGIFDNYAMVQGIDTIVPVDVYVPGCPPRPEGLLYGVLLLHKKIKGESLFDRVPRREEQLLDERGLRRAAVARRRLAGAGDVRHVRRQLPRSPRPASHPHVGDLRRRLPAPEGLPPAGPLQPRRAGTPGPGCQPRGALLDGGVVHRRGVRRASRRHEGAAAPR